MLSRPVQRVLKYPLFISELLKCTEDNSSDKVKLLMALKVMTEVAQCINESKRRKDLVLKYRKEEESNLSSRLSKINIHTLRKKSNRLSMRLSTSIGLVQTIKDQEFDALDKQFKTLEKACRTLLKDLQSYCTQTLNFYNVQLSIAEDLLCLMDSNSSQSRRFCDTLSEILSNDMQAFFDSVNSKVRDPILVIQQTFQGPENLIAKRYDKLLDYESSLSKQMKEKNRADCTDMSKLRSLNEDVRKCKAEYEALNVQLIGELPHLLSGANDILSITTKAFVGAQRAFIYSSSERLAALNNPSLSLSNYTCNVKRSVADNATSISTLLHKKQPIISRKSSGSTISSGDDTKYAEEISLCPKQTNNQKKALIAKYQMNKIFKAKSAYKPIKEMDLSLDLDDIVAVIINKDPTGDSQRWFVDNGVNKGFVPQANLRLYSATSTPDESQKSDSLLPLVSIISDAETPGKDLFLRPTRLAPPIPKSPHLPKFRLGNNISHPPQDSHGKTAGNHPSPQQQPDMEFFVASFDYKPTSSNEVALETGLLVAVHAKHDLQMNTEWWLVENEQGDIGYVPANYLAPV
uniref:Endophilin-A n=1 Tax=Romanomermis culicivorax TaxID=13658 RepID=A0A915HUK1_ROMCU